MKRSVVIFDALAQNLSPRISRVGLTVIAFDGAAPSGFRGLSQAIDKSSVSPGSIEALAGNRCTSRTCRAAAIYRYNQLTLFQDRLAPTQ